MGFSDYNADEEVDETEITQQHNYYPFGLEHQGTYYGVATQTTHKYRYNGQELQSELDLHWTAMDWRSLDHQTGRFFGVDPLAEEAYDWTPFRFGFNNPLSFSDPSGLFEGDYYDIDGNYLGNDGIDDGKIYMVEGSSKFNESDFQEGGKYHNNQTAYNENNGDGYSVTEVGTDSDIGQLARIGYAEFRGSNDAEQKVGMDITLNRVDSENYPNSLEGVIEQPYQYSTLNEGDPNGAYYRDPASTLTNPLNRKAWARSAGNAISLVKGTGRGISQGATLYYSPRSMVPRNSKPNWNFKILTEINVEGVRNSHLKLYRE